ncbi:hypothetical protein IHE45_14G053600 [Dioscorea alata]|uniref:Uncharacterized protein n=1 Tax=Dioscorea alata TaxID=55571 RepID=A0ACB7URY9_DIOAL|nr:hypothetical protein IHE45_14G053600 [Dioscorea alata]
MFGHRRAARPSRARSGGTVARSPTALNGWPALRRRAAGLPAALSDSMPILIERGVGAVPHRRPRSPATHARRGRRASLGAVPPSDPRSPPAVPVGRGAVCGRDGGAPRRRPSVVARDGATWLILPVVICLSQRLSHACASMN